MKSLFVLALVAAQPASQPAAGLRMGGTGHNVDAKAMIIIDIDESALSMQESWELSNESGMAIAPEHLEWKVGPARLLRVDEDVPGFKASDDSSRVNASSTLGAGKKNVSFAYLKDVSGSSLVLTRQVPVNVTTGTLILPALGGLSVAANLPIVERVREMNGRRFLVYNFENLAAGSTLELTINGLPSHSTWPKIMAAVATVGVLLWMLFSLIQGRAKKQEMAFGTMSGEARRDRIVRAIELLERDYKNEVVKEKRYQRRHSELMSDLAAVLREIELVSASPASR